MSETFFAVDVLVPDIEPACKRRFAVYHHNLLVIAVIHKYVHRGLYRVKDRNLYAFGAQVCYKILVLALYGAEIVKNYSDFNPLFHLV